MICFPRGVEKRVKTLFQNKFKLAEIYDFEHLLRPPYIEALTAFGGEPLRRESRRASILPQPK